jgi:hypothetical protein
MLRARCISEGIRAVYPGCVVGVYTPEEVQDFQPAPAVKDMGMVEEVPQEPDGAFELFVPGNDEAYNRFHSVEEWLRAYVTMVARITKSAKMDEEMKAEKIDGLEGLQYADAGLTGQPSENQDEGDAGDCGSVCQPKAGYAPTKSRSGTQRDSILKHLESGRAITPMTALNLYGSFRLAAHIEVLRKEGHNIFTHKVKENGKEYASYTLTKGKYE